MYKFKGTLVVRKISGKYGEFSIGNIVTPIGEFAIKQSEIDEYEEGTYKGSFVISDITVVASSFGNNKSIIEARALLDKINIDDIDESPVGQVTEEDPATENVLVATSATSQSSDNTKDTQSNTTNENDLFSDEDKKRIDNGETISLDPTDRVQLRKQVAYLKSISWRFNPQSQTWYKP